MITGNDIERMFSYASGLDPMRAPKPSTQEELDGIVAAWVMFFQQYPQITGDDLFAAVNVHYRKPGVDFPRPGDLRVLASEIRRERQERDWDDEQQARWEAMCDAKAGDDRKAITAGPMNTDPATAEQRRAAIESFVAMKAKQATVPGVQELNT